jgi:hypothetical protein
MRLHLHVCCICRSWRLQLQFLASEMKVSFKRKRLLTGVHSAMVMQARNIRMCNMTLSVYLILPCLPSPCSLNLP